MSCNTRMEFDVKYRDRKSDREAEGEREGLGSYDLVIKLMAKSSARVRGWEEREWCEEKTVQATLVAVWRQCLESE